MSQGGFSADGLDKTVLVSQALRADAVPGVLLFGVLFHQTNKQTNKGFVTPNKQTNKHGLAGGVGVGTMM